MPTTDLTKYRDDLEALGLDFETVQNHQKRLLEALREGRRPQFPIIDTCRFENGGVLPQEAVDFLASLAADSSAKGSSHHSGFAAFVPAAGAASRYFKPLAGIISACEQQDAERLKEDLAQLNASKASDWPVPERLQKLLSFPDAAGSFAEGDFTALKMDLQQPKALLPGVTDGKSFLDLKLSEHEALKDKGLVGQAFITPPGMEERFAAECASSTKEPKTAFLEQGAELSTIRFEENGAPALDEQGRPSLVPAGHGTLAQLFPRVAKAFPEAHSAFIRNIDNVMGTGESAVEFTGRFLQLHARVLDSVHGVRQHLQKRDFSAARESSRPLLELARKSPLRPGLDDFLGRIEDNDLRDLWEVQLRLFHTPAEGTADVNRLEALYERPVNTMGEVPNTGKDVGGTPCFVKPDEGDQGTEPVKVCVEVPHASLEDKEAFLANPQKATHFNPVFVAAELTSDPHYYSRQNESFWLMAEKTFRGHAVYYFETVLYELLGNSSFANIVFVELPRELFNPHKSLSDGEGRTSAAWLK